MGGSLGNPIDEAAQARINDTINETTKMFAVEFTKAYAQAVIENAKDELDPPKDILDDLKLQEPETPSYILKTGMLVKVKWWIALDSLFCLFL